AMPDRLVARELDGSQREGRIRSLQLLQAGDVGGLPLQPFEERRKPGPDAIDIEGCNFHKRPEKPRAAIDPVPGTDIIGLISAAHTGTRRPDSSSCVRVQRRDPPSSL